jgi:hypothetical protein
MLPDRHGLDVCRALRAEPSTSLVPVVVVTARLAERNRAESFEAGATEFVPKPYTPDQIFKALASAESWGRALRRTPGEGKIACRPAEGGAFERQLTALRCLLRGRSPLGADEAERIASAVRDLCASASSWARERGVEEAACVEYRLEPDRLTLSLLDRAGWLDSSSAAEGALSALFDRVDRPAEGSLVLTRRFDA